MEPMRNLICFLLYLIMTSLSAVAIDGNITIAQIKFENEEMLDSLKRDRPDLVFERIFPYWKKYEERHRKSGLHLWYKVVVKDVYDSGKLIDELKNKRGIRVIERPKNIDIPIGDEIRVVSDNDVIQCRAAGLVNDPLYSQQWHYEDEVGGINLESAWTLATGNREVVVAVMDRQVDVSHPDLRNNIWVNKAEYNGVAGVDDDGNGYVDDIYGLNVVEPTTNRPGDHGTHVAGTIAAVNNNGIGVCGIAGGNGVDTGVRIMTCAILRSSTSGGASDVDIAKCFVYAADNGAVISQNSWNYQGVESLVIQDAINYFMDYAGDFEGSLMRGGLVVFAAGNENSTTPILPITDPIVNRDNSIIVAAIGVDGDKASYSNYGDWIDISAPGGEYNKYGVLSTITNGRYGYMEGTSMACPHVSGIAALVVSKFGGENFTCSQAKKHILNSVNDINSIIAGKPYNGLMGFGIVDAHKALMDNPMKSPEAVADLNVEMFADCASSEVSWTIPEDGNGVAVDRCVLYSCDDYDEELTEEATFITRGLAVGKMINQQVANLKEHRRYKMQSIDVWGNLSSMSEPVLATASSKDLEIINPYNQDVFLVYQQNERYAEQFSEVSLSFPVVSSEGMTVKYSVTDNGNCVSNINYDGSYITFDIMPPTDKIAGDYTMILKVWDANNPAKSDEAELKYRVRTALVYPIPMPTLIEGRYPTRYVDELSGEFVLNLRDYIEDPMGFDLWFMSDENVECGDFEHGIKTSVTGDELHVEYSYNREILEWGFNSEILFEVLATNSYMQSQRFTFYIIYDASSGLDDVNMENADCKDEIYTLTGVKVDSAVENLAPGFYIINGKKTIITNR